jgi:hypothetical protein
MTLRVLFWDYLLIAPRLLLVVALVALLRHRLYRQFPMFFAYVVSEIVQGAVIFPMIFSHFSRSDIYAAAYYSGLALSTALRFGIIHEIFAHMFRNYAVLHRLGKPLFRWVTVGLLLLGLALAAYRGGHDARPLASMVHVLDLAASILQCGLLFALFFFSSYLGLSWRSYLFGIAFGLGAFASANLMAAAIRSETGFVYNTPLNYFTMATYQCCVLVWVFYLLAPERVTQYSLKKLPENDLEVWNQELQRLSRP